MDPNATLKALREAVEALEAGIPHLDPLGKYEDARDVVEHFRALDEWLARGGFAPKDWA